VVSVFVAVVVASILAPVAAQAASQPSVVAAKEPPHAGRLFTGVVVTVLRDVKVLSFFCKATLGGHMKRTSTGGNVYVGGTYIEPAIVRTFARGRLIRATCGWEIPASAAGKLISLAKPGCMMDCGPWLRRSLSGSHAPRRTRTEPDDLPVRANLDDPLLTPRSSGVI
jgi:hypothetical protein